MVDSCVENHRNPKSQKLKWSGSKITNSGKLSDVMAGMVLRAGLSDTTKASKVDS